MVEHIRLLKSVKHDIKAPLKTISGLATLIKSKTTSDSVISYSKNIIKACSTLEILLEDIFNLFAVNENNTQINNKIFSISNLIKSISSIASFQALTKKQKFHIEANLKSNELFLGDEKLITKVLLNIINNAIKYTPEHGIINFETFIIENENDYSTAYFIIEDNGYGIENEYIKDIFKPFTREKSLENLNIEGSGIGLAITKTIIDILGGTIEIKSSKGKGSKFTVKFNLKNIKNKSSQISSLIVLSDFETINQIKNNYINEEVLINSESDIFSLVENISVNSYDVIIIDIDFIKNHTKHFLDLIKLEAKNAYIILLIDDQNQIKYEYSALDGTIKKPFFHSSIDKIITSKEALENPLKGLHFLLAEDNYFNQEIIKENIVSHGGKIDIVNDGENCIEQLKINKFYSAILLDINMSKLNGIETVKIIKNENLIDSSIPIIAISSIEDVNNKNFSAFLNKNFTINELINSLKKE